MARGPGEDSRVEGAVAPRCRCAIETRSAEETVSLGMRLGGRLAPGDVLALSGELGAGKTCLTQGIARGLGVAEGYVVTSPTFTLINEYPGRVPLVHVDVYRLDGCADLVDLGWEEYMTGRGVVVVEWAEKIRDGLPGRTVWIALTHGGDETRRFSLDGPEETLRRLFSTEVIPFPDGDAAGCDPAGRRKGD